MTFEKIIQTIIGDTNDERAEGFLRFLSSKLWGLYNDYLMDKIKVAESEIVWNLNMPNAKETRYTIKRLRCQKYLQPNCLRWKYFLTMW